MYDDKELKEYRDLLPPPTNFEEGFDWKTIIGAIFIGFLMMPGSMYLQLVIGQGIGPAARWVTIILFAEIAKRAHSDLKQQEIFLLYYMAGAALASPFSGLLWNQYLVLYQNDKSDYKKLDELRWSIEEYRIACFAQPMKTRIPVSEKKLQKLIDGISTQTA